MRKLGYPPTCTSQLPIINEQPQATLSPARAIGLPSTNTEQLALMTGCGKLCGLGFLVYGGCGLHKDPRCAAGLPLTNTEQATGNITTPPKLAISCPCLAAPGIRWHY